MKILLDIYESKYFTPETKIGSIELVSIPTSGLPYTLNNDSNFYLTNLLKIKTDKPEKDGEYFVIGSVIYMDKEPNSQNIELYIEKNNSKTDTLLYLIGKIHFKSKECYKKINLVGDIETETLSIILPRTNLDYISINKQFYNPDKVTHNQDGSITINAINGTHLTNFRDRRVLGLY